MSNVPTNLIPTRVTQLPEYLGDSTLGFMPYVLNGRTYKVQFSNIAAVGAVPSTRVIATGNGLEGGGDLSQDRTISIISHGVGYSQLDFTGVVAGTYGSADTVPAITVDATGRVTSITDTPIALSNYVPSSRTITAGDGLSGGGQLNSNITIALDPSNATPQPLGAASAGSGVQAAREDHVHPAVNLTDTTETQGVLPLGRGGTGDALSPVVGAVIYADNDSLNQTTAGNLGEVLTSAGGSGAPYWQAISGTGTVTSVDLTAGTGISVSGGPITTAGSITVTNTAPDQVVSLTAGTGISISGTYPSFTIDATSGSGTVTSVDVSGASTGLTFSGGPITTSGTITLGGTLAIAYGGTGATTAGGALTNLGAAASGANSDITSLSGITGAISTVDSIAFDTGAGVSVSPAQIAWNANDGCLDIGMGYDGVVQPVGLGTYFRIKADSTITNGQCIMATGAVGASGVITGAPATGLTEGQYVIGVATMDIATNGFGYVTNFGLVRGIDTTGSAVGETWADGDILYYNPSVAGGLTNVMPVAPNPKVTVALVVNAGSGGSGSLFIRVNDRPKIMELQDVYAPSPIANGQLLIGDGAQSRWESATLTAGTNVSITNGAGAITINSTDQYTGTVTSVSGTGTVSGLTLSGTVTTSGSLTLGGTLSLTSGNVTDALGYTPYNATNPAGYTTNTGTVTSVAASVPTGFSISGSPITSSGTLAVSFSAGYSLPTDASQSNWDSVYTEWGGKTAPSGTVVGTSDSQTLTNKTLTNPTVTNYVETLYAPAAGSSFTIDLANGTLQEFTSNANLTLTLPSSVAGKSYLIIVAYGGTHTLTWAGGSTLKWAGGTEPTPTSTSGKFDIFSFFCDGTNTYGCVVGQNY